MFPRGRRHRRGNSASASGSPRQLTRHLAATLLAGLMRETVASMVNSRRRSAVGSQTHLPTDSMVMSACDELVSFSRVRTECRCGMSRSSVRNRSRPRPITTVRCRSAGGSSVSRQSHKSVRSSMDSSGRRCTKTVANKQISGPWKFMQIQVRGLKIRTVSVRVRLGAPGSIWIQISGSGQCFRVVAWTSVASHRSEWTTETADFRSAYSLSIVKPSYS